MIYTLQQKRIAVVAVSLFNYWQHCSQRNAPVFKLLAGHFEVFRPACRGNTLQRWGEIWHGEVHRGSTPGPLLHAKFHPHRCKDKGIAPPKMKLLLGFHQKFGTQTPCSGASLTRFSRNFQNLYLVLEWINSYNIWINLLKGYGIVGVLSTWVWFPPHFQRPLATKLCIGPQHFRGARTCSGSSITVPSLVGLRFQKR